MTDTYIQHVRNKLARELRRANNLTRKLYTWDDYHRGLINRQLRRRVARYMTAMGAR